MDAVQTVDAPAFVSTIDVDGFWRGTIRSDMVSDLNRGVVVEEPLPDDPLGPFERWRWVDVAWTKCADFRGHSWYDPLDTGRVHNPETFDDAPPARWTYWPPGENPVRTQDEALRKEWGRFRARRNKLLAESDWVVVRAADRGEPVPTDWQTYRQALRDVTDQPDPFNIVWPTPPG